MKINARKTQMLCISASNSCDVNTFINIGEQTQLLGQESLKMLGFTFGRKPTAELHILSLKKKFYGKTWILRHLIKAGLPNDTLTKVYSSFLRPVLEYASIAYHCLLTEEQSKWIEGLQLYALKLILGRKKSYKRCLEESKLDTLKERRVKALKKFAENNAQNPRFNRKWFPLNEATDKNTRHREKYALTKSAQERKRKGTLNFMRRYLNELNN